MDNEAVATPPVEGNRGGKLVLPSWDESRFAVLANRNLYDSLMVSLQEKAKSQDLGPWTRLPDEIVSGTMEAMLDPWCGIVGQLPLSQPERIAEVSGNRDLVGFYDEYVRSVDHLSLLNGVTLADLGVRGWRLFDLGSLIDFLHISAFMRFGDKKLTLLEIGGGYGRLAEFLPLITGSDFFYINIDAAPVSLMYCHEYLRARFPDKTTRMFRPDASMEDCDFLLVPSWHADALPKTAFDLALNIESMQEMNQGLVDYYISFLDERATDDSLIYFVNSREWLFKGAWNFPPSWETLYRHRSVRSWTADHPVEVFRKTSADVSGVNRLRSAAFKREVVAARQTDELRKLQHEKVLATTTTS
jgi:hypothetical protein